MIFVHCWGSETSLEKTEGFLTFLRGKEMEHWACMG